MKGRKPDLGNVIPMKGDAPKPVPEAPEIMSEEGRRVWDRLAPIMARKDRLEEHHVEMFAVYCEAAADVMRFTIELLDYGFNYTVTTRNGQQEKKRAAWGQRQDALSTMRQVSALFGMSPVDERRMASDGQGDLLSMLEAQLNGSH
ncbi:P27 family phage terminase small subunit [Mesobaculum littorinae]|uniref:P27 family phage terminase small subunit n=1 Tax=Mesobaculum littorinae TaxID=2486419 RepID=A0A438ALI3_9RHOB|nr:P27 family phage terminase small subunit [Mesobaculum littorinae]RVV99713.1 P27 family phage terminase small subunit [Mesobaculum littorinae]